jgi:hypothetical protein
MMVLIIYVISARDSSGNFFFDSTAYNITFRVASENKVMDVYNYPNPFADDTYFTFNITGTELPEEMNVKFILLQAD